MDLNSTLNELAQFSQYEKELLSEIGLDDEHESMETPSQRVVDNILNYSKALSVRPSKNIDWIEVLNN